MPDLDVERLLEATKRRSRQLRFRRRLLAGGLAAVVAAAIVVPAVALTGGSRGQGVIVSPGPTTSTSAPLPPTGGGATVVVPDVVGQTYAPTAQMALAGASLLSRYTLEHSETVLAGTVISETPAPGSNVASGATVTVVVSIGPAQIAGAPPCRSADLKVQPGGPVSEATGQNTDDWSLTNVGGPCVLQGYPVVSALDSQGRVLGFSYSHSGDQMTTGAAPQPVYLPTGSSAWVRLNKYRCDVSVQAATASLRFTLPSGGGVLDIVGLSRGLDYCSEAQSLKITVSPFEAVQMLLGPS